MEIIFTIYGVILSTVLLGWNIYIYKKSLSKEIIASAFAIYEFGDTDLILKNVIIEFSNNSQIPLYIMSIFLDNKETIKELNSTRFVNQLPYKINTGEVFWDKIESIKIPISFFNDLRLGFILSNHKEPYFIKIHIANNYSIIRDFNTIKD
jgi:hypothetical protein